MCSYLILFVTVERKKILWSLRNNKNNTIKTSTKMKVKIIKTENY